MNQQRTQYVNRYQLVLVSRSHGHDLHAMPLRDQAIAQAEFERSRAQLAGNPIMTVQLRTLH